jgi:hypothetical protein
MANRVIQIPETKGKFQCKGIVSGTQKDKFFTQKKTTTGSDFRAVNFGCEFDDKKTMYINLTGMPRDAVYFSKRDSKTKQTETKAVPWKNRFTFSEDGFNMIGVRLGLTKTTDENGEVVNDKKTLPEFDACEYIAKNLTDDVSVFVKGKVDFSSYTDKDGNLRRSTKYVPEQISLCQTVDFEKFDYIDTKPINDFVQTIVFNGIEKESVDGKYTDRYVVSAYIVTYNDVIATEFIMVDDKLAGLFKKNLKPYHAIEVLGHVEVTHMVDAVEEDNFWGEVNTMERVSAPSKVEMVITGAKPSTIDEETYTKDNIEEAIRAARAAKNADKNFNSGASSNNDSDWGESDDDSDLPWE